MSFDIFNPNVTKLNKNLEGQQILVYGQNSSGKSLQASRMCDGKVLFLPFEDSLRAIAGAKFFPVTSWAEFKKINRQLTKPATLDKVKEMYNCVVIDEVYTASKYLSDYICKKHGVESIAEGRGGFGLWKEFEDEWFFEMDKLMKAGFTLMFIGHEDRDRHTDQIVPKGDKRTMQFIRDNADIVVHLRTNGVDKETGRVIPSTAYLAETPQAFARSRFQYIDPIIPEYTAENLTNAIIEAIKRQEEADGIQAVSYEEQKALYEGEKLDFESTTKEIGEIGNKLAQEGHIEAVLEIVENYLGKGKKVTDAKPDQVELLSLILVELKDLAEEKQIA